MGRGVGTGHSQTRPLSMARARAPYTGQSASSLCAWELQPRNVDKDGWPTNRHSHKLVPLLPVSLVESQCQCLHRLRRNYEAVSHSISIHLNVFIVSLLCSCLPSKKRANQRGRERKKWSRNREACFPAESYRNDQLTLPWHGHTARTASSFGLHTRLL